MLPVKIMICFSSPAGEMAFVESLPLETVTIDKQFGS